MKKILIFLAILLTASLTAQEIALPDVVTQIETQTEVVSASEIPDFENVLEVPEGSLDVDPQLPEIEIQENQVALSSSAEPVNKIYADGKLGGGFPALIYGDFNIYQLNEANPFKISFTHDSAAGYGANSLNDGFNDSQTDIQVEKGFTFNNIYLSFGGNYKAVENGLQNKGVDVSEVSQNLYSADVDFKWSLPKGFSVAATVDTAFYNRYADLIVNSKDSELPEWIKGFNSFSFIPAVLGNWNNKSFNVDLSGTYWLDTEYSVVNRGEFGSAFYWKNDFVKLFADATVVCGNKLNFNQALIPFSLGINSNIPVKFSGRRMCLNAQGGMESFRTSIAEYEQMYRFSGFSFDATETSNWYGLFEIVLPVKTAFTTSAKIQYKQTAFNNGVWQPEFTEKSFQSGIYGFNQSKQQLLVTDFTLLWNYKMFTMNVLWHSNWLDVPVLESSNALEMILSLESKNLKWNVNLFTGIYINNTVEVPVFNLNGMFKITDEVQLMASIDDIVNLCTGNTRIYGGVYSMRSGSAALMVKFFF